MIGGFQWVSCEGDEKVGSTGIEGLDLVMREGWVWMAGASRCLDNGFWLLSAKNSGLVGERWNGWIGSNQV